MKIKILLLFFIILGTTLAGKSQNPLKIGHVNVKELVQTHPDIDSIYAVLEQETRDMEEVYAQMVQEQQSKMDLFEKESAGYSEIMKKSKQEELLSLSQKIQNYNQTAQQRIRQRNMDMIQPIYESVNKAIETVAEEKGLTYVLDVSTGNIAYISKSAEDITPLVKKILELK